MILIYRFMLKSLGQWTAASLKPRKVIPSELATVPPKQLPSDKKQEEENKEQEDGIQEESE